EEVTLNSVNTIMQRVRELAVQAGNGALSQADRQSISAELGQREDELLGLMNTRNARGEYLFAGFQGKSQPFVRNPDGSYSYTGDEGQRTLQISASLNVPISDNGLAIFQSAVNAGRLSLTDNSTPAAPASTVSGMLIEDEVAFANFPAAGIQLDFDPTDPTKYSITNLDTGEVTNGVLEEGKDTQVKYAGTSLFINGTPPGGASFVVTGPDANPASPPPNKVGILNTIADLRKSLESAPDSDVGNRQTRDAVALAITNLDNGMTTIDLTRGKIGARLNTIESTQTDNDDVSLVNKSVQADLRELDYAEALSRLSFQSIILEAAQQSYVKISGLNLFNKL
ncbi:MAG TPA: flagellar hook-associated protein 3, partial [Pseudomonas sp.]|nr:flagellar hook-associated protein 3 [Pseudomonas sp.]